MMNKLKNISTSELLDELIERNALFRVDCGLYRNWELKGKYQFSDIKLPSAYPIYVGNSIIDCMIKWECEH
ncbi:hypothetical protein [Limosilactobacillus reuteri]|uniref:hypothetical protein n=1 Tax=Limosilactobacillus reuteri TaxID=1598 RepID=UPI00273F5446|nr:hypothetical protein [Limosilactobacillus reuteri]WLR79308.1 hypothetical protein Q3A95_09005 [Limosilactobacillus reuteri]